jgi:glycosyltransferase involved in cell wall biosynthesis
VRAAATARRFGLVKPFLLYVGTRERRKNLMGLIEIFARVRERRPEAMLAVVGARPWAEAKEVHGVERWSGREVEDRIRELGVAKQIRILGHVSLQELVDLYSAAEILLYPTYYEGFGLPALEAMACGLPVVASSRSALPEVVGDAGLLAEPDDHDAFAREALRVLGDDHLRERCRSRGLERASLLTWEATARGTLRVYREALQRC